MNIEEKLKDLLKQATEEHSHYYVASVIKEAIAYIIEKEIMANQEKAVAQDLRENFKILQKNYGKSLDEVEGLKEELKNEKEEKNKASKNKS